MTDSAPRVVVTVSAAGTVTARTEGMYGEKCLDYIEVLENLLEARTVESSYTEDHSRTTSEIHGENLDVDRA